MSVLHPRECWIRYTAMAINWRRAQYLLAEDLTDIPVRYIDELFDSNGIALGPENPQDVDTSVRRARRRRYLTTLDLDINRADQQRFADVLAELYREVALVHQHGNTDETQWKLDRWTTILQAAGFRVDTTALSVTWPPDPQMGTLAPDVLAHLNDPSAIEDHLERIHTTIDSDPRLAVATARSLMESTAKIVLTSRGETYTATESLTKLVSRAQTSLGMSPKGLGGEQPEVRQLLQSLQGIAVPISTLRNDTNVHHGAEVVPQWVRPRHARLVVGAAQLWCQTVLETLSDPTAPWRVIDAAAQR